MKKLALIVLAVFPLQAAFAGGPGTTTGELLKIPVGSRAIGMGEAYTAAAEDTASLAWNPAGLSFAHQKQASFMHSSLLESIHYEHISFISPGDTYSYGASLGYLGFGDIAGYGDSDTGAPVSLGNQSAYSMILSGGGSKFVWDNLSVGITGSLLRESLAGTSANTFAANLGTQYRFPAHPWGGDYKVGMSILNLGPGLKYISERDPLPRKIKFGASVKHIKEKPLNLTLDVTNPNDNSPYVALGSEYWFKDIIGLRLGYAGSNDEGKGLRVGMGLKLREFLFDYAYGSFGDFGATHRIELSLQWGQKIHQLNKEAIRVLKEARLYGDQGDYPQQIMELEGLLATDPTNDRILKYMIAAHDRMLESELRQAVAEVPKEEIPEPEQFALQDLVPGQQALVKASPSRGFDPSDPLGLDNLPDAEMPGFIDPVPAPAPAFVPAPSAPSAAFEAQAPMDTPAPAETHAAPASDGVLLNPADIYGN